MQQTMVILPGEGFTEELARAVTRMVLAEISSIPNAPLPSRDEFLTTGEVLGILRITAPTLRKLRKSGKVRTYGEGTHHHRFRRSEVETALMNM